MSSPNSHQTQIILPQPWHLADSLGVVRVRHCLYARIGTSQNGPNCWGYLPGQWRLANVAYPLFPRQGRVNDGGGRMGPWKGRLAESFRPPLRPPARQQARRCFQESPPDLRLYWSGWGDLNSRPSVPQIDAPQTADLHKRPKTASGLPFEVLNSSRWFALFRDVSRPVRGLPDRPSRRSLRRLPDRSDRRA